MLQILKALAVYADECQHDDMDIVELPAGNKGF